MMAIFLLFVGTFAKPGRNKLSSADECDTCPPGYYCAYGNQSSPTGKCAPGYYCGEGSHVPKPTNTTLGGKCFAGHFCVEGSDWPKPCPAGKYNDDIGKETCKNCPAGFFCPINTTSPYPCPPGYYCPLNSMIQDANPCPQGTFNNLTSRTSLSDCQACIPGSYCSTKGTR